MKTSTFSILCMIVIPFSTMWNAFVGLALWTWFVTPTFGIIAPSFWIFAGLALFVRLLTVQIPPPDENADLLSRFIYIVIMTFSIPAGSLFFGWIYHLLA